MSTLESARVPDPGSSDHIKGEGPLVIVYMDVCCPRCAAAWPFLSKAPLRLCIRHFPLASRHSRSPVLHATLEAAARQGSFWLFLERLLLDRGRTDDPHLWQAAEDMGLDPRLLRLERREEEVLERVDADFRSGVRAGVVSTPAAFHEGTLLRDGRLEESLRALIDDFPAAGAV